MRSPCHSCRAPPRDVSGRRARCPDSGRPGRGQARSTRPHHSWRQPPRIARGRSAPSPDCCTRRPTLGSSAIERAIRSTPCSGRPFWAAINPRRCQASAWPGWRWQNLLIDPRRLPPGGPADAAPGLGEIWLGAGLGVGSWIGSLAGVSCAVRRRSRSGLPGNPAETLHQASVLCIAGGAGLRRRSGYEPCRSRDEPSGGPRARRTCGGPAWSFRR